MHILDFPIELGLISIILTLLSILISVANAGGHLFLSLAFRGDVPESPFDKILTMGSWFLTIVSWGMTFVSVVMWLAQHISLH